MDRHLQHLMAELAQNLSQDLCFNFPSGVQFISRITPTLIFALEQSFLKPLDERPPLSLPGGLTREVNVVYTVSLDRIQYSLPSLMGVSLFV